MDIFNPCFVVVRDVHKKTLPFAIMRGAMLFRAKLTASQRSLLEDHGCLGRLQTQHFVLLPTYDSHR